MEDALRIARDRLGHVDAGARLFADLIDVLAGLADDDGRVLRDNQAAHLDLLRHLSLSRGLLGRSGRLGGLGRRRRRKTSGGGGGGAEKEKARMSGPERADDAVDDKRSVRRYARSRHALVLHRHVFAR